MPEIGSYYSMDEKDAVNCTLPDPLLKDDGSRVSTAAEWMQFQREKIFSLLKKYEYGEILPRPDSMQFEVLSRKDNALNGTAIRKEVRITCSMKNGRSHAFEVLIYLPKNQTKPVPAFLGPNFYGNHATTREEDVRFSGYVRPGVLFRPGRGDEYSRHVPDEIIKRGYASVTFCYHDIHPDKVDSTQYSVFKLFFEPEEYPHIWERYSVIGAWAWGLSRVQDYLESDPEIDDSRVAVYGLSRLGKTSLWAGAIDPRYKVVISTDSGCAGGALHKRKFGENLSQHFTFHTEHCGFPCWFVKETEKFIWHEEDLPFDQHELLAMIAPRPLVIATATKDLEADPMGEFLACKAASEVYRLFGSKGLEAETFPAPDVCLTGDISFHCRTGIHEQTLFDWQHYMDIADRYL